MKRLWNAVSLLAVSSVLLFAQQESRGPEQGVKAVASQAANKLDVNTASNEELSALKGIGEIYAAMIIRERPYGAKSDLLKRKVIPAAIYEEIKDENYCRREYWNTRIEAASVQYPLVIQSQNRQSSARRPRRCLGVFSGPSLPSSPPPFRQS
jgi:competence protein ComEA